VDGGAGQAQDGAFTAIAGSCRKGTFPRLGGNQPAGAAAPGAQTALPVQAVYIRHFGSIKKMLLFTKAWDILGKMQKLIFSKSGFPKLQSLEKVRLTKGFLFCMMVRPTYS
jgi:hypothetical protein